MDSVTPHLGVGDSHALDVPCPHCTESLVVVVIEDRQHSLDEGGHELALATSAPSESISDLARWEDDGGASAR
jgi:hypothetical protein